MSRVQGSAVGQCRIRLGVRCTHPPGPLPALLRAAQCSLQGAAAARRQTAAGIRAGRGGGRTWQRFCQVEWEGDRERKRHSCLQSALVGSGGQPLHKQQRATPCCACMPSNPPPHRHLPACAASNWPGSWGGPLPPQDSAQPPAAWRQTSPPLSACLQRWWRGWDWRGTAGVGRRGRSRRGRGAVQSSKGCQWELR